MGRPGATSWPNRTAAGLRAFATTRSAAEGPALTKKVLNTHDELGSWRIVQSKCCCHFPGSRFSKAFPIVTQAGINVSPRVVLLIVNKRLRKWRMQTGRNDLVTRPGDTNLWTPRGPRAMYESPSTGRKRLRAGRNSAINKRCTQQCWVHLRPIRFRRTTLIASCWPATSSGQDWEKTNCAAQKGKPSVQLPAGLA